MMTREELDAENKRRAHDWWVQATYANAKLVLAIALEAGDDGFRPHLMIPPGVPGSELATLLHLAAGMVQRMPEDPR